MKKWGVPASALCILLKRVILLTKWSGFRRQVHPPPTVDTREPGAPPGAGTRALTRDCRALTSMKEALM